MVQVPTPACKTRTSIQRPHLFFGGRQRIFPKRTNSLRHFSEQQSFQCIHVSWSLRHIAVSTASLASFKSIEFVALMVFLETQSLDSQYCPSGQVVSEWHPALQPLSVESDSQKVPVGHCSLPEQFDSSDRVEVVSLFPE